MAIDPMPLDSASEPTLLGPPEPVLLIASVGMPREIGGYRILEEIGRGGMGVVYRAADVELKRNVALKMLFAGAQASPHELSRFRGEAEIIAQLAHPNIVQIFDVGEHEGRPFLALELVDGGSLDRTTGREPQPARRAASTIETLARAIHVAHGQGIIHRDLKPANVLVAPDGTLKITDFGLAKRLGSSSDYSRTGELKGTPSYMAPEQADGRIHDFGPTTDVYSLGAILYELLTGRPPFMGVDVFDTLEQVRSAEPAPPSRLVPRLPRDLSTICLKCLEKNPQRRYPDALSLAEDLRRWLNGDSILARPVSRSERFVRAVRRHPLMAGLVFSSGLAVLALVLWGFAAAERAHALALRRESEESFDHSLKALNGITDLLINDDRMKRISGLEPLHAKLLDYYGQLVNQPVALTGSRREQLAGAYLTLGRLMSKTGAKENAKGALAHAAELFEIAELRAATTGDRRGVASTYLEMGKVARDLGNLDDALGVLAKAQRELETLCAQPAALPDDQQLLAEAWHLQGEVQQGYAKEPAHRAFEKGRQIRTDLVRNHPGNASYRKDLARSYGYLGDVELDLGRAADAMQSYQQSHQLREQLATEQPNDPVMKFQLARSHRNFATIHVRMRDFATARAQNDRSREIQEALVQQSPADAEYRTDLSDTYCRIADLNLSSSDERDRITAAECLNKAINLFRPNGDAVEQAAVVRQTLAEAMALKVVLGADAPTPASATAPASAIASTQAEALLDRLCQQRPDAQDFYYLAVLKALAFERSGDAQHRAAALTKLRRAIVEGHRRKHPIDFRNERAFKSIASDPEFLELMAMYQKACSAESGESR